MIGQACGMLLKTDLPEVDPLRSNELNVVLVPGTEAPTGAQLIGTEIQIAENCRSASEIARLILVELVNYRMRDCLVDSSSDRIIYLENSYTCPRVLQLTKLLYDSALDRHDLEGIKFWGRTISVNPQMPTDAQVRAHYMHTVRLQKMAKEHPVVRQGDPMRAPESPLQLFQ